MSDGRYAVWFEEPYTTRTTARSHDYKLTPAHVETPLAQDLERRRVQPLREGHQDRPWL